MKKKRKLTYSYHFQLVVGLFAPAFYELLTTSSSLLFFHLLILQHWILLYFLTYISTFQRRGRGVEVRGGTKKVKKRAHLNKIC